MQFHFIELSVSIFEQLLLEEYLLRHRTENFCLVNQGSPPSIVMGISGKVDELVNKEKTLALGLPLIRRFSGGGTVCIDESTLFISFICNKKDFSFPGYPERILRWSEEIYKEAFQLPNFALRENDFVLGEKKCGGNAQYITKDRFVQHTSFLWDFSHDLMESLLQPRKAPAYRQGRSHLDFLCTLKEHLPEKEALFDRLKDHLASTHELITTSIPLQRAERTSTHYLFFE